MLQILALMPLACSKADSPGHIKQTDRESGSIKADSPGHIKQTDRESGLSIKGKTGDIGAVRFTRVGLPRYKVGSETTPTIQDAIDKAEADSVEGAIIKIPKGAYDGTYTIDSEPLIIWGGGSKGTILDGNGDGSVFTITDSNVLLARMTITDGEDPTGGGIDFSGSVSDADAYLALRGVSVTDNVAVNGGGISNVNGNVILGPRSYVQSNTATNNGGGIYTDGGFVIMRTGSNIQSNTATNNGGGIYSDGGGIYMRPDSVVRGNTASNGGGIYSDFGAVTISGQVGPSNTADYGGGIYLNAGGLNLDQYGTVSDNDANFDGGGIYSTGHVTMFSGSTISGNTAGRDGGGICSKENLENPFVESYLTMYSGSTISGNTAGRNGGGFYTDLTYATSPPIVSTVDGQIANNEASYGGGIYVDSVATVTQGSGGSITGNRAEYISGGVLYPGQGGGVFINTGGSFTPYSTSSVTGNYPDNIYPST
jgi:predicted outer membrane repeat protein